MIMGKLKRMLAQWNGHEYQHAIPLSTVIIQAKAKRLFHNLNAIEPGQKVQSFAASAGWFESFKGRHGFHNLKLNGEAAAADFVAVEKLPAFLQATTERHRYLPPAKYSIWMRPDCSGHEC
jgi:hypothetical protein